jgi:hypothetical protein
MRISIELAMLFELLRAIHALQFARHRISTSLHLSIALTTGVFDPKAAAINGENLYLTNGKPQSQNGEVLVLSGWR